MEHEPMTGQEARDESALRGRWSNGDPVHIVTDGVDRWVAPNRNGATWIPEEAKTSATIDRYAEHDRVEREGGSCSCGDTFPAPQEALEVKSGAPNEPGIYLDRWGSVWRLWRDGIFAMLGSDERQDPDQYAPFARLLAAGKHPEPEITEAPDLSAAEQHLKETTP